MKNTFSFFMVFMQGFIVCANITKLVNTNPNFRASWANVLVAVLIALFFAVVEERN